MPAISENWNSLDASRTHYELDVGFAEALASHGEECCRANFVFAQQHVQVRVIGRELANRILRPFSHLRIRDEPGEKRVGLSIDLWDENATGVRCQRLEHNLSPSWFQDVASTADKRLLAHRLPNTLTCLDRTSRRIVGSMAFSSRMFCYELGKPLTLPLLQWYGDLDNPVIHAGLVSRNGDGVLLVGRSGAGKTTLSLSCICAGMDYVGEDYIGLQHLEDGTVLGHSLYNSAFLETTHMARFSSLAAHVRKGRMPYEPKSLVILNEAFPDQLLPLTTIRALALPRVTNLSFSSVRPASKAEALRHLGTGSLLQIPNIGLRAFDKLVKLVERVPCYSIDAGRDIAQGPASVDTILRMTVGECA